MAHQRDEFEFLDESSDPAFEAWRIMRLSLEYGRKRYGLDLRGSVIEIGPQGAKISLVCIESHWEAIQKVPLEYLWDPWSADIFEEEVLRFMVEQLAKRRTKWGSRR